MLKSVTDNCRAIEKRGWHNLSSAILHQLLVRQMNFASLNQPHFWCHDTSGGSTRHNRGRSQVHRHKEGCIVQQRMWEVHSVCQWWSVGAFCQHLSLDSDVGLLSNRHHHDCIISSSTMTPLQGNATPPPHAILLTPMYFCFTSQTQAGSECCPSCCARFPVPKPIVAPQIGLDSPHRRCRTSSPRWRVSVSPDIELAPSSPRTTSPHLLPRMVV